ncbi:MAG: hypothetical protein P4M13_04480 [Alphaproteobacteria bacterium]|nr:hypothetical protein [Alphaproteobacteria bacterium]
MSIVVPAEILSSVFGLVDSGVLGVFYQVKGGTDFSFTNAVEFKINEPSLADAHGRNNSGSNAEFAKALDRKPKAGSALSFVAKQKCNYADNQYAYMLEKRGLTRSIQQSMARAPQKQSEYYAGLNSETEKNPLKRVKKRRFLESRRMLKGLLEQKPIAKDPESLPQHVQEAMVEDVLRNGGSVTPLGSVPEAIRKTGGGYNDKFKKYHDTWDKWSRLEGWEGMSPHMSPTKRG